MTVLVAVSGDRVCLMGDPEINNFECASRVEHQVRRLDVPVHHSRRMSCR